MLVLRRTQVNIDGEETVFMQPVEPANPIGEVRIYHDPQKDGIDTEFVTCLTEDELKLCMKSLLEQGLDPVKHEFVVILTDKNDHRLETEIKSIYQNWQAGQTNK